MVDYINQVSKDYPLIGSTISIMLAGGSMYLLKDVPTRVYFSIKRQLFTTVNISNEDWGIFSALKKELSFKKPILNRMFKISASYGVSGNSKIYYLSPTGGSFYLKIKNKWCKVSYSSTQFQNPISKESKLITEKETYSISYFGTDPSFARDIMEYLKDLENKAEDPSKIKMYAIQHRYQKSIGYDLIDKRYIDSVFINKETKHGILNTVRKYLNSRDFYRENGIPYRLNIMLYGEPGTGKTSLIKAIASEFDLPIYLLGGAMETDNISELRCVMQGAACGIVAFEDVDSLSGFTKSDSVDDGNDLIKKLNQESSNSARSGVLNFFDGINSLEGFICILTTNFIDKIDPAVIRPGRMHLKIEIPPLKLEDIPEKFKYLIKDGEANITGATLQERFLEDKLLNK